MMTQFDVSRTVLREALKTLESKGLVEARPKIGTKVSPRNRWNYFDHMVLSWIFAAGVDEKLLRQLTEVRLAMEPQAAGNVALTRTIDDLRMMQYWVRQMEKSEASALNLAIADFEFHVTIAEAARNPFMRSLLSVMEIYHACVYRRAVEKDLTLEPQIIGKHLHLVECIERQDAKKANLATRAIIEFEFDSALKAL
jgi:DNA-binding FadR family transcriptional regulator